MKDVSEYNNKLTWFVDAVKYGCSAYDLCILGELDIHQLGDFVKAHNAQRFTTDVTLESLQRRKNKTVMRSDRYLGEIGAGQFFNVREYSRKRAPTKRAVYSKYNLDGLNAPGDSIVVSYNDITAIEKRKALKQAGRSHIKRLKINAKLRTFATEDGIRLELV